MNHIFDLDIEKCACCPFMLADQNLLFCVQAITSVFVDFVYNLAVKNVPSGHQELHSCVVTEQNL